jgi:hypothetical protein
MDIGPRKKNQLALACPRRWILLRLFMDAEPEPLTCRDSTARYGGRLAAHKFSKVSVLIP